MCTSVRSSLFLVLEDATCSLSSDLRYGIDLEHSNTYDTRSLHEISRCRQKEIRIIDGRW